MRHKVHRDTIHYCIKLSTFLQLLGVLPPRRRKPDLYFNDWDTNLNIKSIGVNPIDPLGPYVLVEYYE